jgi:hypothetical protein
VSSRRVADQDDALSIQRVSVHELVHELDRRGDVVSGTRPQAADVAAAAVLDVPGGDSSIPKCNAEMAGVDQVVGRFPGAAVNDHRERPEPVAGR